MKTLTNHTLIYDAECPLCNAYTSQFIKQGMLDKNGRTAFADFDFEGNAQIDKNLACNRIALINTSNNEITYGINSLLKVIGFSFPLIAKIGKQPLVYWFLNRLYNFISYNRKMIAPGKSPQNSNCNPEKNLTYRLVFIVFCGLVVHFTVTWFFQTFLHSFLNHQMHFPDFVLYVSQFPIQALVFYGLKQKNFYDYAGQIAAVSLFGALLLGVLGVGLLLIQKLGIDISLLATVSYGMVYMFMFLEHLKRVKLYQLSTWLCVSWFVFRLAIYPLVFKLY
jgi:predicted DCC family thiol-disulfide oxidoreductase YuxK